jgi:hypothetical protein
MVIDRGRFLVRSTDGEGLGSALPTCATPTEEVGLSSLPPILWHPDSLYLYFVWSYRSQVIICFRGPVLFVVCILFSSFWNRSTLPVTLI